MNRIMNRMKSAVNKLIGKLYYSLETDKYREKFEALINVVSVSIVCEPIGFWFIFKSVCSKSLIWIAIIISILNTLLLVTPAMIISRRFTELDQERESARLIEKVNKL